MTRHVTLPRVLVAIGIALLVAPALVPVQPMLFHDTGPQTAANATQLQEAGVEIIAYEDLSERGQRLYVESLRTRGEYAVPVGEGAPEFDYDDETDRDDPRTRRMSGNIAIERPPNASLPPADEPTQMAEQLQERQRAREQASGGTSSSDPTAGNATAEENRTTPSIEDRERQIARYDLMSTRTGSPPLTAGPNVVRLLSVVVGVVAIGVGGYYASRP